MAGERTKLIVTARERLGSRETRRLRKQGLVPGVLYGREEPVAIQVQERELRRALTGAAGPQAHGGADPGTVWVALDTDEIRHARGFTVPGERARVRRWAEQAGLDLVRRYLEGVTLPETDRVI